MNKKLYVGNLPLVTEEKQLQELFGAEGRKVLSIKIITHRKEGYSSGFAFVEMSSTEDAQSAIDALNGKEFLGRALSVDYAKENLPSKRPEKSKNSWRRMGRV